MRELFFSAVAANPKIAPSLMNVAWNTLRPFNRFLQQAVHTAKRRQFRYQLPWERVRDLKTIHLTPLDHRVWIPRRQPAWRIVNWPLDIEPDASQKLMVVNRSHLLDVVLCGRDERGLYVRPSGELLESDQLYWCGRQCLFEKEKGQKAPSHVTTLDETQIRLLRPATPDEDGWILHLEGQSEGCELIVDGELTETKTLPALDGLRRLRDINDRKFELKSGTLRVEDLPADGPLTSDTGIRFDWHAEGSQGRKGAWVQLLLPASEDSEEFLDPRAAFCEDETSEVWTQPRRSESTIFRVKRIDRERYQLLLDRLPPDGTTLFLPVDIRNLQLQRRALNQLSVAPLPHHQGLLRLCEDPERVRWPRLQERWPTEWKVLTDNTRSGTDEQRRFVAKALGSPDFAFLEGPPGSGKTTAICELIHQLVLDGQRILLCGSTHVAIDNVLERLLDAKAPIDAVRIGKVDRVDENVRATQIDQRVEDLVQLWRTIPHLQSLGDAEITSMAERSVVMSANLTCGTTMGIVNHPLFRGGDWDPKYLTRPISMMPHWDVLIVDEASKTLIQEFLVPALMARRWIVVGDVRQLPPFADRGDIVANLRALVDENERDIFPPDHQRACILLYRLARRALLDANTHWLIVEPPGVLDCLGNELQNREDFPLSIVRVVARTGVRPCFFREISIEQVAQGDPSALTLAASDLVLVGEDILPKVATMLPANLLHARDLTRGDNGLAETHSLFFRHSWWLSHAGRLRQAYRERADEIDTFAKAEMHEQRWLSEHDTAGELAWRLTRTHELRRNRNKKELFRLLEDIERLKPTFKDISESVDEIHDIGLPSILEVLQEGIGVERSKRPSALTEGLLKRQPTAFNVRFERLSYQHRMHAEISEFPRELIYNGQSLQDANTVEYRNLDLGWNFNNFSKRRVWIDICGREQGGVNADEIRIMEGILRGFLNWTRRIGPPNRRSPRMWEVACICFYVKQERAISEMLRHVTGDDRQSRFSTGNVDVTSGTVDRFQGREADLVLLSMRNTRRVGFLDSLNRLNVAVTRARQQLVIVGNADYFKRCQISELEELVKRTPCEKGRVWLEGKK